MFRHDQLPGRPFINAGFPGFPFLDIDLIHFRETEELQHMRDVYDLLQPLQMSETLNQTCIGEHNNESFDNDFSWRLKLLGVPLSYWDLALADMPLELSERFALGDDGPIRPATLSKGPLDPSVLANQADQFKGSHLVLAPFRCFHRRNGTSS